MEAEMSVSKVENEENILKDDITLSSGLQLCNSQPVILLIIIIVPGPPYKEGLCPYPIRKQKFLIHNNALIIILIIISLLVRLQNIK